MSIFPPMEKSMRISVCVETHTHKDWTEDLYVNVKALFFCVVVLMPHALAATAQDLGCREVLCRH